MSESLSFTEKQKSVLRLRLEGLSTDQIADALGMAPLAVSKMFQRMRGRALRAGVDPSDHDWMALFDAKKFRAGLNLLEVKQSRRARDS